MALDQFGNIHVVGETESINIMTTAYLAEFFPDCSLIQIYIYGNGSSSARDIKVDVLGQGFNQSYNISVYITGWVDTNFPNPMIPVSINTSTFTPNITVATLNTSIALFTFQTGTYQTIIGNLNHPIVIEAFVVKYNEVKPIIPEFPNTYLLIMLLSMTIVIIKFMKNRSK